MAGAVSPQQQQLIDAENALVETHAALDALIPLHTTVLRELLRLRQGARERRPVDA
jgi:hypothetical protein